MNVGRTIDEAGTAVEPLTAADGALLAAFVASEDYDSNGSPAPEAWERLRTAYLDANNDQHIDLYDWYGFQVCEGVSTTTGGMNDHLCLFLYDLDGDDEVSFNEGQQGCNLFTGTWGTPGDGHPGQATGSRFGNPFMWTGQRYDAPTGLYHFVFRSYSPKLGRWLQRDPQGNVDGPNLYAYVGSYVTSHFDRMGLDAEIHTNRSGPGNSKDDWSAADDDSSSSGNRFGHTWMTVTNDKTGETEQINVGPNDDEEHDGDLEVWETNKKGDIVVTVTTTVEEEERLIELIKKRKKKIKGETEKYGPFENSCVSNAIGVLDEGLTNEEIESVIFPDSVPGTLEKSIKNHEITIEVITPAPTPTPGPAPRPVPMPPNRPSSSSK